MDSWLIHKWSIIHLYRGMQHTPWHAAQTLWHAAHSLACSTHALTCSTLLGMQHKRFDMQHTPWHAAQTIWHAGHSLACSTNALTCSTLLGMQHKRFDMHWVWLCSMFIINYKQWLICVHHRRKDMWIQLFK